MTSSLRLPLLAALVFAFTLGCPGKDGKEGTSGAVSLVALSPEPAGANCALGGVRIDSGVDADGDSTLDPSEVADTEYVCTGSTGTDGITSLLSLTAEPAGANCANGGTRVQSGLDANRNSTLDAAEVAATAYVCSGAPGANGLTALASTTAEPAGANCADGGTRIESGLDANGNGTLDAAEIAATQYACDGAAGTNGQASLVSTSVELAGANCTWGGVRVESGLDADGDAILDAAEVAATQYVCNGAPGADGQSALLALSPEPAGANCPNGGTRVDTGLDADRDAILDAAEVSATRYVCDGADGANGQPSLVATTPEAAGANCANGGVRVQSGLDADGDATLDVAEVAATQYVCNGADGADGQSALVSTAVEPAGASCAFGGVRVQSGLDADSSGVLDAAEVALTQYVCDGAPGAPGTAGASAVVATTAEGPGANCQYGGTRMDAGLDADGDATLDPAELTSTQYVCNGAPGTPGGLTPLVSTQPEPAGANCPYGGSRVLTGLDADADGVLDAAEVTSTSYVCNPDNVHPTIVSVTPASNEVGPDTVFCVAFSEAMDASSIHGGSLYLTDIAAGGISVTASVTYDAATYTACLDPVDPLPYGGNYDLFVAAEAIRDAAGNALIQGRDVPYLVVSAPLMPNLRVRIDAITAASGTIDVAYTVSNDALADASAFTVGFFVDPTVIPGVGSAPDASVAHAGLAGWTTQSGTITLTAAAGATVYAYVDVNGTVAEAFEDDNLGGLPPTMTGSPTVTPTTVVQGGLLSISVPVSVTARSVRIYLGGDISGTDYQEVGWFFGNAAGEGTISGSVTVPASASVERNVWVFVYDGAMDACTGYVLDASVSTVNYTAYDPFSGSGQVDSGLPLTAVTYAAAGATPVMTGAPTVSPSTVAEGSLLDVTVPVSSSARRVDVYIGADVMTTYAFIGSLNGNTAGEGYISGSLTVPPGTAGAWSVWVLVYDETSSIGSQYYANSLISTTNYTAWDATTMTEQDSGIPLTFVTVTGAGITWTPVSYPADLPYAGSATTASAYYAVSGLTPGAPYSVSISNLLADVDLVVYADSAMATQLCLSTAGGTTTDACTATVPASGTLYVRAYPYTAGGSTFTLDVTAAAPSPNLVVTIDSVTDLGGGFIDVAFTVTNAGSGSTAITTRLGLFSDPAAVPTVGATPDVDLAVLSLGAGSSVSDVVTLAGSAASAVYAYADLYDDVVESNEGDNLAQFLGSGPTPVMTGSPTVSPNVVEQNDTILVTVPVSSTVRWVDVWLGTDLSTPSMTYVGTLYGNTAGEGYVSGTLTAPFDGVGAWNVWILVYDEALTTSTGYVTDATFSTVNYAIYDTFAGVTTGDSGIPLADLTVNTRAVVSWIPVAYPAQFPYAGSATTAPSYFEVSGLTATEAYTVTLGDLFADVDLYVYQDAARTTLLCRSTAAGANPEACTVTAPASGPLYVVASPRAPGGSSFTLGVTPTGSGVTWTPVTYPTELPYAGSATAAAAYYAVSGLTPGASYSVSISDLYADVDLFVYADSAMTTELCYSAAGGAITDACTATVPASGTLYVRASPYVAGGSTFTLDVTAASTGPTPVMTGSPTISPSTVAEGGVLTVTVPVNATARQVTIYVGADVTTTFFLVGTLYGNTAGEGYISGSLTLPLGTAGVWSVWALVYDETGATGTQYYAYSTVSTANYTAWDVVTGTAAQDSGIPLTSVTVTP